MAVLTGRERSFDLEFTDSAGNIYLAKVARKKNVPLWTVPRTPEFSGQALGDQVERRSYHSWHLGGGYENTLAPNTYHWAEGLDTRLPRMIILGPKVTKITVGGTANTSSIFDANGRTYVVAGRYCKRINSSTDAVEAPNDGAQGKDFGAGITATSSVRFDSASSIATQIVFIGNASKCWEFASASTWTQATNDIFGSYGTTLWMDTTYVLARNSVTGAKHVVTWLAEGVDVSDSVPASDPNPDWGAEYPVGDASAAITNITSFDRTIFVAKADGLYYIDRTGRTPCVVRCYTQSSNNGRSLSVDSAGNVWFSTVEAYYRYNPMSGEVWDCSPWRGLPNGSPIYGQVTADCEYMGWRYAFVYNGTDSYLMVGRPREPGEAGIGPYIWHGALAKLAGAPCNCAYISTATTNPRLYFGWGPDVGYFRLPRNSDNPLADSEYRYTTSAASLYMPADNWGVPGGRWCLLGWEVENSGFGSLTYADFYVQLDGGSWQLVPRSWSSGVPTAGTHSLQNTGISHLNMLASSDWRFTKLACRVDITNAFQTSTPKITAIVGKAEQRASMRDVILTTVLASDAPTGRLGATSRHTGRELITALKNMQTDVPITLVDYWTGTARTQTVLVRDAKEVLVEQEGDAPAMAGVELRLIVLTSSVADNVTQQVITAPAVYGTARFGVDRFS